MLYIEAAIACFLFLLKLLWCDANPFSTIVCNNGMFDIGQKASVTCTFHTNLKTNRIDFYVALQPLKVGNERAVVQCNWLENGELNCLNKPGFVLRNNEVSDHLTVDIQEFKAEHVGVYECQVIGASDVAREKCFLGIQGDKDVPQSSSKGHDLVIGIVITILVFAACSAVSVYVVRTHKVPRCHNPIANENANAKETLLGDQEMQNGVGETTAQDIQYVAAKTEITQTYSGIDLTRRPLYGLRPAMGRPLSSEMRTYPMNFNEKEKIKMHVLRPRDAQVQFPDLPPSRQREAKKDN